MVVWELHDLGGPGFPGDGNLVMTRHFARAFWIIHHTPESLLHRSDVLGRHTELV